MDNVAVGVLAWVFIVVLGFALGLGFGFRKHPPVGSRPSFEPREDAASFRELLRPHRPSLTVGVVLIFMTIVLHFAALLPVKVIVDHAIGRARLPGSLSTLDGLSRPTLAMVAVIAGVAIVVVYVLSVYLIKYIMRAVEIGVAVDLRTAIFKRLQRVSLRYRDRRSRDDLMSVMFEDVPQVARMEVCWYRTVLPGVITLIATMVILLLIDAPLALAGLVVIAALVWRVEQRPAADTELEDRADELDEAATATAENVLEHALALQASSMEQEEEDRFQRRNDRAARVRLMAFDQAFRSTPMSVALLAAGAGLTSWLGVVRVIDGHVRLGTLMVMLAYLAGLYVPLRALARVRPEFTAATSHRARIIEIFADRHLVDDHPDAVKAPYGSPGLSVSGLSFGYDPEHPVLQGVNLEVKPRNTVCVVGGQGAGKSTLFSLILRLYAADGGSVELGGIDTAQIELRSLRNRVALIAQDPWMVDATIAENISASSPDATPASIMEVATTAQLSDLVDQLPHRFNTVATDGGAWLPLALRRKVALARALLRDASVLLLDEPTSGLNGDEETEMMKAIAATSRGRTVLIATSRTHVAQDADWVILLEGGHVVEQGTHASLVALEGRYAQLSRAQRRSNRLAEAAQTSDRRD